MISYKNDLDIFEVFAVFRYTVASLALMEIS